MQTPLVAIRCITYNHEKYIRQALDGFMMQRTTFPFVAIVHDDASTDGTADIIRQYADRYPDIIIPLYESENQYSKKDGSLARIVDGAVAKTGAKYVAICEGDDYWTDPLKLQKQVDFLEFHPEYSIVFHNADIANETTTPFRMTPVEDREYTTDQVFLDWVVPTASIVIRRDAMRFTNDPRLVNGDIWCVLCGLDHGRGHGMTDFMAVYRRHARGVTIMRRSKNLMEYVKCYIAHYQYLKESFPKLSRRAYNRIQSTIYWQCIFKKDETRLTRLRYALKSLQGNPKFFFCEVYKAVKAKIQI